MFNMESQVQNVNIDLIIPNRFQPRLAFDEKALQELAESIKQHGIIQPLVVRRLADRYEIIAGERRYKAAVMAGLTSVPVILTNLSDAKSAEVALVENIQRKNLSSIEEAKSYKRMLDKDNLTQEQLANKLGLSQSTIANKLRLLNLSEDVQNALLKDKISERHARSLLQISDKNKQTELLNKVISDRLTVRQLDELIKNEINKEESNIQEVSNESINNNLNETSQEMFETIPELSEELDVQNNSEIEATMPEETLEDLSNEAQSEEPMSNILSFLQSFNNQTPSLDDEPTNMQTFDDNIFNANDDSLTDKVDTNDLVVLDDIDKASVLPENQVEDTIQPRIISGDLSSLKKAYHDVQDEAEKAGFKVSMEDFDFEDLYQIIIKIDK